MCHPFRPLFSPPFCLANQNNIFLLLQFCPHLAFPCSSALQTNQFPLTHSILDLTFCGSSRVSSATKQSLFVGRKEEQYWNKGLFGWLFLSCIRPELGPIWPNGLICLAPFFTSFDPFPSSFIHPSRTR